MQLKKIQTRIFCGQKPKVFIKIKYPEQVAEPESCVTVRIFLFGAVSSKKRYLPTAPFLKNSFLNKRFVRTYYLFKDGYNSISCEDRIKMSLGGMSPLEYRRSLGIAT